MLYCTWKNQVFGLCPSSNVFSKKNNITVKVQMYRELLQHQDYSKQNIPLGSSFWNVEFWENIRRWTKSKKLILSMPCFIFQVYGKIEILQFNCCCLHMRDEWRIGTPYARHCHIRIEQPKFRLFDCTVVFKVSLLNWNNFSWSQLYFLLIYFS
jgi:hypothetical protein